MRLLCGHDSSTSAGAGWTYWLSNLSQVQIEAVLDVKAATLSKMVQVMESETSPH